MVLPFAVIPADPETLQKARATLGKNELILWITFASHVNQKTGVAWPGIKRLKTLTGMSKSQVHLSIARLIENGFIGQLAKKVGRARVFRVLTGHTVLPKITPHTFEIRNQNTIPKPPALPASAPPEPAKVQPLPPTQVQDSTPPDATRVQDLGTAIPSMVQDFGTAIGTNDLKEGNLLPTEPKSETKKSEPSSETVSESSSSSPDFIIPEAHANTIKKIPLHLVLGDFVQDDRQELIDELVGQLESHKQEIANPGGYLFALAKRKREGTFFPAAGIQIKNSRAILQQKQAVEVQEQIAINDEEKLSQTIDATIEAMGTGTVLKLKQKLLDGIYAQRGFKADQIRRSGGIESFMLHQLFKAQIGQEVA